ncbi:MAG: formate--tetrahydrofolate ligase, partial [Steroidobacteraceae bacterium]
MRVERARELLAERDLSITDVAAEIGLGPDDLDLYGKYKAKDALELTTRPAKGKLVIVTAINPTA